MTVLEAFQLATSSGVLAGGLGILKWALAVERRLTKLEIIGEVQHGNQKTAQA